MGGGCRSHDSIDHVTPFIDIWLLSLEEMTHVHAHTEGHREMGDGFRAQGGVDLSVILALLDIPSPLQYNEMLVPPPALPAGWQLGALGFRPGCQVQGQGQGISVLTRADHFYVNFWYDE